MQSVRSSNLELFRIITMLVIVAHHYVVNSGLMPVIFDNYPSAKSLFLLWFGWGGKTGINCFVLITGFFMCTSQITLRKGLKLLLEVEFYKVLFFAVFTLSGYAEITPKFVLKSLMPIVSISKGFVSCFLVFFLFIPFLNILIKGLTRRQHVLLIVLCLMIFSILPIIFISISYSYVSWFMVIYLIGSYLRLYPPQWSTNSKIVSIGLFGCVVLSFASVWGGAQMFKLVGYNLSYFLVADSNKPLAVLTAVFAFLFFKNLKMGYSKFINTVAASAFGVLLIHANSDTMRQWLWRDTLDNVGHFDGNIYLHAIASVLAVYVICTIIDFMRIQLLEKRFFKLYDHIVEKRKQNN